MSNKYWNKDTAPSKQSGGEGGSNEPAGSGPESAESSEGTMPSMTVKTANWPGLPGKAGSSRAGGAPTKGYAGPFLVKQVGM